MRVMSLDISKRNIGFAMSDSQCKFVSIYDSFPGRKLQLVRNYIHNIKQQYEIDITIVGLPLSYNHKINNNFLYVKNVAHVLRDLIKPYVFIDERMSTNLAEKIKIINNNKKSLDAIAAATFIEYAIVARGKLQEIIDQQNFAVIL